MNWYAAFAAAWDVKFGEAKRASRVQNSSKIKINKARHQGRIVSSTARAARLNSAAWQAPLKRRPLLIEPFAFDVLDLGIGYRKSLGDLGSSSSHANARVLDFDQSPEDGLALFDGKVLGITRLRHAGPTAWGAGTTTLSMIRTLATVSATCSVFVHSILVCPGFRGSV